MNENTLIWLFGIVGAWLVLLTGTLLGMIIAQVKTNFAMNLFIGTLEDKIGKALHNDDNHLGLDQLIDQLTTGNKTETDYFNLKNQCNWIVENKSASREDRLGAAQMAAICEFVLITRFGKTKATV
jgi:hypothetical protein